MNAVQSQRPKDIPDQGRLVNPDAYDLLATEMLKFSL